MDPAHDGTADPAPLPLAGLRVAVPASRRAAETEALIARWGGTCLVGPILDEVPVADEAPMREATSRIIAAPAGWSVHLTGVGTRRWFGAAAGWGMLDDLLAVLHAATVVARGPKSTKALTEYGLQPTWAPTTETSTEIAGWLGPQVGPGDTVAVQLYGEPVPALTGSIAGRGAEVVEVVPYRWSLPLDPERRAAAEAVVAAIAAADVQALVVTSAVQAANLFAVARELGLAEALTTTLADRVFTAAVGDVSAGGLRHEGVPVDYVADPARLGALIRGLALSSERIRAKAGVD